MKIGKRIRTARIERGYSQEKLAEHFNISVQAISKWECEQSFPDISFLPEIADYLQVSLDYLLRDENEKRQQEISLPDDNKVRIVQCIGNRILEKKDIEHDENTVISVCIESGFFERFHGQIDLEIWGNAEINQNVYGNVRAGKNITCDTVAGNLSAGGSVTCDTVNGDVMAGACVICDTINGDDNSTKEIKQITFEFGLGLLPYVTCEDENSLLQRIKKLHSEKDFPKVRICDNEKLEPLQYRIIVNNKIIADNSVKHIEEENWTKEIISFIKFEIL